ncbi:MFS general substrate transporter [Cyathus striatus]|nr:MFS general substrate transporter [Cyathus striatus]
MVKSEMTNALSIKSESDETSSVIDPNAEKKLLRKLDIVLLPMFTLIYCCNFIDRTSIGNARIAGLEKDLGMKGFDLNIALTVYYICYVISDVPSNLLLKRFGSIWIAFLVIVFGVVSIGAAFVKSFAGMLVTRIFLGLAEGGTLSGLVYITARYYRRKEFVLRTGIFFGLAPTLAGAFGGLLASGLLAIPDFGVVVRWRKIFLIEGIITTGIGILLLFFIPDDPRITRFLNDDERALAIARIDADQVVKTGGRKEKTTLKLVLLSFNVHTTLCVVCFIMINISFQGLSLFLPTVITTLGKFGTIESQLRTVPVYLVGAVWAVFASYFSFRIKQRTIPMLLSVVYIVIGYAITIATKEPHARYAACFLSVAGGSPTGPLLLIWGTDNAAPDTMRAVVTAAITGFGSLGAIIAVWTYLPADAPNYHKGNSLNLATSSTVIVLIILGFLYLRRENAKRERGERDYRLENKTLAELEEMGYLHPQFRYQL